MKSIPTTIATLLLISGTALAANKPLTEGTAKPNILFIFADDHAFNAVGFMGNKEVKTPHLDKLSEDGATFTHAYNMGAWNGAVCVASRGMLNTGRFIWHSKAADFGQEMNKEGRVSLWSENLRKAGYETYFAGKWHTMGDQKKLFDHCGTLRGGMPRASKLGYKRPAQKGDPDPWSPSDPQFGGYWIDGKHFTEVLGDEAVDFIGQAAKKEKPFFMYLAFNAPHDPRQSPQRYVDMYPEEDIAVPANFVPLHPYKKGMGCGKGLRDERLAPFPRTEYAVRMQRGEYYAMITHMDDQIGRILEALEKSGKKDNTYVIYSADHGLAMGSHGLFGKQSMYEHSMRAPLVLSGPGIEAGKRISRNVYIQDLMPSTFELAGESIPAGVEFKSLVPLLKDEKAAHYDAVYGAYLENRQRMIIHHDMKLILFPAIAKMQLFNLKKDPDEMEDLSSNPEYKGTIAKMFNVLQDQQKVMGDELDLTSIYDL